MTVQYGNNCISPTQVYEYVEKFKQVINRNEDSPHPSRSFTAVMETNIAKAEDLVRDNHRCMVREIVSEMKISTG